MCRFDTVKVSFVKLKNYQPMVKKLCRWRQSLMLLCGLAILCKLLNNVYSWDQHIYERQSTQGIRHEKQAIKLEYPKSVDRLMDVYLQLHEAHKDKNPPNQRILKDLEYVAAQLYPPVNIDVHNHFENLHKHNTDQKSSTSNSVTWSMKNLVTALVHARRQGKVMGTSQVLQLIKDFQSSYLEIHLFVIGSRLSHEDLVNIGGIDADHVTLMKTTNFMPGASWNNALRLVKTPMVFIARGVTGFSAPTLQLQKLVRVLREVPGVGAVSGTLQTDNKKWAMGCYQNHLKNYVLRYREGHQFSKNESVFCDYIDGPFVTYMHLMKNFPLDEQFQSDVIFQDFFLRVSEEWLSLVRTDVTFRSSGPMTDAKSVLLRASWLDFARKWELNRIDIASTAISALHKYSCKEVGISCGSKISTTNYYATPVCCHEDFVRALDFLARFCKVHDIGHQFDSGTCLGAVKMGDILPWDRDGDGSFIEPDYNIFKNAVSEYKTHGFLLGSFQDPACCDSSKPNGIKTSYFRVFVSDMDIEMWGEWNLSYDSFLFDRSSVYNDTKMEIHGVWVNGPPNPGYYARKRYGPECLRHAQSWVLTGKKSSWEPYDAGHFIKCRSRRHHSCLDGFPTDGNIAFMVPEKLYQRP